MGRNKGLYVFGLLMLLIYWGMAFLLLGSSLFVEQLTPAVRYGMGIVFFGYGCFRAYRQLKSEYLKAFILWLGSYRNIAAR